MFRTIAARTLAVIAIVMAWHSIYTGVHPSPPAVDPAPHMALGRWVADRAMDLQQPGARLILFARDPGLVPVPAAAAQVAGFLEEVGKAGRKVAGTRWIRLDPLRLPAVPSGDFFDQIRKGRSNDVIVSFLGPPVLDEEQLLRLGPNRPRIIAVCPGSAPRSWNLLQLFEHGLLAAVLLRDETASTVPGKPPLGRSFRWVTPANLAELVSERAGHQ